MAEENTTEAVAQPEPISLTLQDLNVTANIIDLAVQRGALKRCRSLTVGNAFNKLVDVIPKITHPPAERLPPMLKHQLKPRKQLQRSKIWQILKHVGQITNTQRRCVVVFREVPDEPENCLIVDTDAPQDWMHDDVINAVESPGAQASPNFYEYAQRSMFTDGFNMLQTMNARNLLQKVRTDNIMMTPNQTSQVKLNELNDIIREQPAEPSSYTQLMGEADMQGKDTSPVVTEAAQS